MSPASKDVAEPITYLCSQRPAQNVSSAGNERSKQVPPSGLRLGLLLSRDLVQIRLEFGLLERELLPGKPLIERHLACLLAQLLLPKPLSPVHLLRRLPERLFLEPAIQVKLSPELARLLEPLGLLKLSLESRHSLRLVDTPIDLKGRLEGKKLLLLLHLLRELTQTKEVCQILLAQSRLLAAQPHRSLERLALSHLGSLLPGQVPLGRQVRDCPLAGFLYITQAAPENTGAV